MQSHSLVFPTFEHDAIDLRWTAIGFIQPLILIDKVQYLITLHTLSKYKHAQLLGHNIIADLTRTNYGIFAKLFNKKSTYEMLEVLSL